MDPKYHSINWYRKRLAAHTARRFNSVMRYCADTQQRIVGVLLPTPAGRSQVGTAFLTIAAQKKGASPLPILFLALISTFAYQRLIPARTTYRG